ncbi:MAG: hypothetical protein IKE28_11200 [Solobacterium sp.]|nr:hypothetical protein [Solobacterium sp.]
MIRLCTSESKPMLCGESVPAKLFVFTQNEPAVTIDVKDWEAKIGTAAFYPDEYGRVMMDLFFEPDIAEEAMRRGVDSLVYYAECTWKPSEIVSFARNETMKRVFNATLFYPKGTVYKRMVEPWRYRIKDRCFDSEGYIIDQGAMQEIRYGVRSTREAGCGWIAAYNFFKLNGQEKTMQETVGGLSRFGFGELRGENFLNLFLFLKRGGIPVRITFGKKAALERMRTSKSGILLYSTKLFAAHYACWKKMDDGRCCFYNAVYGKRNDICSPDAFIEQNVNGFTVILIYIS